MKKFIIAIAMSVMLTLSGAELAAQAEVLSPDLEGALNSLGPNDEIAVILTFVDKVDLSEFEGIYDKSVRRSEIVKALKDQSSANMAAIQNFLTTPAVNRVVPLWAAGGAALSARAQVIQALVRFPGVESIRLDGILSKPEPVPAVESIPEWNISAIGASELWNLGYTGLGVVVASMDTGVDANHVDLSSKWRGGSNSWYDPNGEHATPYDRNGHGTRVMGVMVGGDAGGTAIGVAPDAQWIAVKIFNDAGSASYSGIHQGFQWLLDPDDNPGTDDAPDVVNNSWGFPQIAGQCFTEFRPDIQTLKAAEIAVVFSAGNGGPYEYTSESPANYPESFAVGAVDADMNIAYFSSRGPSVCDGSPYPEVVAPGVNVRTSDLGDWYMSVSGTSIAAPHVSGTMALLLSAFPGATVSEIETAIKHSAYDLGVDGPDNVYGYGVLDATAAYALLEENQGSCADSDGDGFYAEAGCGALQDCDDSDAAIYPGATEIKHDGIDQDCNGYDLTIDILKAEYTAKKDSLVVQARSDLGQQAGLQLVGFGAMKWDRKKSMWTISLNRAGGNPGTVTVSGIEGSETAETNK
jgi:serine protease AprX